MFFYGFSYFFFAPVSFGLRLNYIIYDVSFSVHWKRKVKKYFLPIIYSIAQQEQSAPAGASCTPKKFLGMMSQNQVGQLNNVPKIVHKKY